MTSKNDDLGDTIAGVLILIIAIYAIVRFGPPAFSFLASKVLLMGKIIVILVILGWIGNAISNSEPEETTEKAVNYESDESRPPSYEEVKNSLKIFKPITKVRHYDESVLEAQLFQHLAAKLGKKRIETQVTVEVGRVDLLIDSIFAVELKICSSRRQFEQYMYQFSKYAEYFPWLFIVVHDMHHRLRDSVLDEFEEFLLRQGQANFDFIVIR